MEDSSPGRMIGTLLSTLKISTGLLHCNYNVEKIIAGQNPFISMLSLNYKGKKNWVNLLSSASYLNMCLDYIKVCKIMVVFDGG